MNHIVSMAQLAVSFIVPRVARKLSDVLIQESAQLVEVADQIDWIAKELGYMQEFVQYLERSNSNQLEMFEEMTNVVARQAEDVIDTFLNTPVERRKKGIQYLLEKYNIAKELEPICNRVREISERISNYLNEPIAVTIETPRVRATTIVSPALEELDHILTQNLIILDEELIEIVEHVRDKDLGDTHNIVSKLNSAEESIHSQSQRARVWLKDIENICADTVAVAENFIATRRKRLSRTGWLWQVFYFFEQRVSERKFKQQMEYIRTQLEDALYRRWTFGDGGKDMGDKIGSRSRPAPSLSLVRLTLAKVPLFLFNSSFAPLLFVAVITTIDFFMFGRKRRAREHKLKEKKKSRQLTPFLWFDLVDFMVYVFFYAFPAELWIVLQFVWIVYTVIPLSVSLERSLDENLETIRRYLALMDALFSDINTESAEGLNKRQQVWVNQLRLVAHKVHSLSAYPKPRGWNIVNKIIFAEDITDFLNEILDISDKKNIYGFASIQGRKELVSTVQRSESKDIAEHSGAHPQPYASSSSYQRVTGLRSKYQLIKDEMDLMNALIDDVGELGKLEGRSEIWVEQMKGIASEAEAVIRECDSELESNHYFKHLLVRYKIMGKIDRITEEIEDASRRRNAYGLVQLQSRDESLSTVQMLRRKSEQPSLIGKESIIVGKEFTIIGFNEDVDFLTDHLLSNEESCCVTSIVGIEGTGKTTLARLIFDNKAVEDGFTCRVPVSVSPGCTVDKLLEEIAKEAATQIMGGQRNKWTIQEALRALGSTKYLILVDGIETCQLLDSLTEAIPDKSKGSRFLLTTRNANIVARQPGTRSFVYHLQLLDDENSWILFKKKLKVPIPSEPKLIEVAKKIVAKCGGLPLEILKMSELLSNKDVTEEQWSRVQEQPNPSQNPWSETLSSVTISLPSHLRRCLFYLELFPANFGIPARRLVVLWVAEGLVQHGENQEPPEQVAERYLTKLIDLNLVQIAKRRPNGKVKTCRLPNALREILVEEVQARKDLNSVSNISRIRQVADRLDRKDKWDKHMHGITTSDSASLGIYKDVFSFLSFDFREGSKPGQDISNFLNLCISSKCLLLLRVLDLEGVHKPELPENIKKLARLRYLGLRWTYLESLPSSISKLLKLQTLDLKHTYIHTLTNSIWKMELRHLFLSETYRTRFPPKPRAAGDSLSDLQTLWGLFVDEETPVKGGLDKLVNIRKLGIACQSMSPEQGAMQSQLDAVADWIVKLEYLQSLRLKSRDEKGRPWNLHLKSLKNHINLTDIYLLGNLNGPSILTQLPPNLVELTLSHSKLEEDPMKILKDLPNLRSLSLHAESYIGIKLVCNSKSFPQLYVLKVWKLEQLKDWEVKQQALPSLRQLEIRSCLRMTKLPDGLKHVNSLLELKLTNMPVEINTDKHNIPPNCEVHRDDSAQL